MAGRTVYNAGSTVYNAGRTVYNAAKTAVNNYRAQAKRAAKKRYEENNNAGNNFSTRLNNKYTQQWDLQKSDKAKQGMENLQNRVYERNRRA